MNPIEDAVAEIAQQYGLKLDEDRSVRLALYAAYRAGQWDEMAGLTVPHQPSGPAPGAAE